ncbi:MAG: hypothetical protein U5N58_06140 [Actinomycetota bacterium]|nr:hypothetical protein [Actinomycetota bacterium]
MEVDEKFWNAELKDLKKGSMENENNYECLLCGRKVDKGIIYTEQRIFYEPESYMHLHINKTHRSGI